MEVGKNVYYTVNHLCHMVLALKPFGCMPSTQSDGVQSRVVNKYKDMIFLPIETSGEGEVNAHSRVQMALGRSKGQGARGVRGVLEKTGKSLDDLREYVDEHPKLTQALYQVPHREGVAGTAAQFACACKRSDGQGQSVSPPGHASRFRNSELPDVSLRWTQSDFVAPEETSDGNQFWLVSMWVRRL